LASAESIPEADELASFISLHPSKALTKAQLNKNQ